MELILFDKYLVRGYEFGFILSKVREDKIAEVLEVIKPNSKGVMVTTKDYSNFGRETYHSTFEGVLRSVRRQELSDREIKTIDDLSKALKDIKNIELNIQSKFK